MLDIILVIVIVVAALVAFASEKFRADLVALLVMGLLMVIGLIRPNFPDAGEAISGFANKATVTIAAMFILSAGLLKTGAINWVTQRLMRFGSSSRNLMFVLLMLIVGTISAFINNAAAVAVFIPITLTISKQQKISPSKLLIPVSFASIVGGTCTLIGTSTNILVSSMAADHGLGEFAMFELSKLGIIFFAVGMLYLYFYARNVLPERVDPKDLTQKYSIGNYLTRVTVEPKSPLIGRTAKEAQIRDRYDVTILDIVRGELRLSCGIPEARLKEGDILLIQGGIQSIIDFNTFEGLSIRSETKYGEKDLTADERVLAEGIISPTSRLAGSTLKKADFRNRYGAFVLAIRKPGGTIRDKLGEIPLEGGDTLLLQGRKGLIERLNASNDFLTLQEKDLPRVKSDRAMCAFLIVAGVVASAAFGISPILVSAIVGCLLMVLTGCISLQDAYDAIDWFVIFLLAGVIPLGVVMEKTGTAEFVAQGLLGLTDLLGVIVIIPIFYLLSTLFAGIMSHNAAVILLVPIGVASAHELHVDPMPFLMAITFAASSSLFTPFGYHTNLMVYGPGRYKFADFLKVGIPLNVLLWIVASIFIPIIWPL
ncbi:MAG: anion permease [Acidobacteriota bacterium]|nr:MAG: anion permease [Acidobacteriota bacterium]